MLCKKCGKELQEDAKFCLNCGAKIEEKEGRPEDIFSGSVKPSDGYPASGTIQAEEKQAATGSLNVNTDNMKFCTHCGKRILKDAVVCPYCGCATDSKTSLEDEPNKGLNIISFLLPILGAILYLIYHEKEPKKASALGKWALYGLGFSMICYILLVACAVMI